MTNKQIEGITEVDAYGCHITIEKMGQDRFHVTIAYRVYNDLGTWIASPQWGNVGTGEQSYKFLLEEMALAIKCNHIRLDIPALNSNHTPLLGR